MRRVKRKAAAEGRTVTSLIEDGLRRVLDEREKGGRANRVMPPVSTASGRVMPGIDISNNAALQEMDDLEYVRRMKRWGRSRERAK